MHSKQSTYISTSTHSAKNQQNSSSSLPQLAQADQKATIQQPSSSISNNTIPAKPQQQQSVLTYHQFIIIGAGISGMQAGLILAEKDKDFIILQASDRIGGRIRTEKLEQVIQSQNITHPWTAIQQVRNTTVQVGATWISKQHPYMLKLIQEYELTLYPQYSDGLAIYGVNQQKYEKVQTLADFYKKYQKQLLNLVRKIENLQVNMYEYQSKTNLSPSQSLLLEEYIKFYDNIPVSKFIKQQIKEQELAEMIMNEMETLECISCDKFSVLQLIDDDGCMELLKLYCQKVDDTIDGLKVKEGMLAVIRAMEQHIYEWIDENRDQQQILRSVTTIRRDKNEDENEDKKEDIINKDKHQVIHLNSPVQSIQNQLGQDVIITLKNGKRFSCLKVFFSVPVAVANNIRISNISPSKQMIFDNQEYGSVTRFYFVFKEAFWRGKYNGYASFSRAFPFNELTQLSPASLSCGILAFVFVHNKYEKWIQDLSEMYPDPEKNKSQQIHYLLGVITDMFLEGDRDSQHLQKGFFCYTRSFTDIQYIRAAYQTTTKPQVWKTIKDNGDDYNDSYSRDQYNIVYIGSEIAESDDHASYMEGAVRIARQKVYKTLGEKDPWEGIKEKKMGW